VPTRTYDVVLLGASGFTGKLTAEYLARKRTQEPFRLALAGRSREKLEAIKQGLVGINPACADVGIIPADVGDLPSLKAMAGQARVLITTVGPYFQYGEPVVKACVEERTDYVDLTGEPDFISTLQDRYDAPAREAGVRIVNCCGFDCIPADLGTLFTVDQLQGRFPEGERGKTPIKVEGFMRMSGSFSGGTWHSLVHAMSRYRENVQANRARRAGARQAPNTGRRTRSVRARIHYRPELRAWAVPIPTADSLIVRRSATAVDGFSDDFQYGHYLLIRRASRIAMGAVMLSGMFAMAQLKPTRNLLLKIRDPGEGPTDEQRQRARFTISFLGEAGAQKIRCEVRGGDPGYGETSKMLSESALCLALERDRLPPHVGIITPAMAMGRRLIERLQAAGIEFRVVPES
jgi:short subunit dehydrogenase-like uncharacterized protein